MNPFSSIVVCFAIFTAAVPLAAQFVAPRSGLVWTLQVEGTSIQRSSPASGRDPGLGFVGSLGWAFAPAIAVFAGADVALFSTQQDSVIPGQVFSHDAIYSMMTYSASARARLRTRRGSTSYLTGAYNYWIKSNTAGSGAALGAGLELRRTRNAALDVGADWLWYGGAHSVSNFQDPPGADPSSAIRLRVGVAYRR